jgi:hypothetical protein
MERADVYHILETILPILFVICIYASRVNARGVAVAAAVGVHAAMRRQRKR